MMRKVKQIENLQIAGEEEIMISHRFATLQ
jgi:hypothetical protein